ncbi:MAG: transposase [Tannerella sp.]|jgi:hypothetical protein|nr:transposase [Tannerella sp.]
MYRRSSKSSQLNLFTSADTLLRGKALKFYTDTEKWHNQFRVQITNRIDEDIFRPLFHEHHGAPNASIRVLTGMMILKEAHGWSDAQLFEQCNFNILTRSALGLLNMDDSVPVESTYYLLRTRIVNYEVETSENLIETVFSQVTKSQAIEFQINGNKIRMDSKLMGSNIAWYSRYELIHETVRQAYFSAKPPIDRLLSAEEAVLLGRIAGETGDKVSWRSTGSELATKLSELGQVIYTIINGIDAGSSVALETLRRVFNEQYQVVKKVVSVRPKQDISASSVQSPNDTDCQYRQKGDQQVRGYSANLTETCDADDPFNLVTNVLVDTAGASDCGFLQTAIEETKGIVTGKIESVNADGAYHSPENQDYCEENEIDLILCAIQGKPSRYDLSLDESGDLVVTDLQTNTTISSRSVTSRKEGSEPKWAILNEKNQYRYFTQKDIETCILRRQITARTPEELNRRNNVEATIFQLGYHYPNAKSRYRGLVKHKMWANCRCLWINFVRIANYVAGNSPDYARKSGNLRILPRLCEQNVKIRLMLSRLLQILTEWSGDLLLFLRHQRFLPLFAERSVELMIWKK